ncbi:MAG TPA: hypothetical protein VKT70_04800 [Stellaceae bacterium]|nr:hypothetical protein [Stellaceae bacterium]
MKAGRLTEERKKTHGDWPVTARATIRLKLALRENLKEAGTQLSAVQLEALDMILAKIARIVSGDPNFVDHWRDVSGYAQLGGGFSGDLVTLDEAREAAGIKRLDESFSPEISPP